jgi:phosphoribosylformylglycinamidine synthase
MFKLYIKITDKIEECINIELKAGFDSLHENEQSIIIDLLSKFNNYNQKITLESEIENPQCEIGPILNFSTPWCSNALEIIRNSNIVNIERIEKSLIFEDSSYVEKYFDQMTMIYYKNLNTFKTDKKIEDTYYIKNEEIERYNLEQGLSLDETDIKYYKSILGDKFTNVELFDLSQSNSEHSRHWFFNGEFILEDGTHDKKSLFKRIKETNYFLNNERNNSLNAFSDNASCIEGYNIKNLNLECANKLSNYKESQLNMCPTHTAETHNFPTGICPFPGATTGTGGRIRDSIAIGRGGNIISGYVGYSVGDISKNNTKEYPYNKPRSILIEASNGASDYGNKIGEPVIQGYMRSYCYNIEERIEYVKPIMYCGGIGSILKDNVTKNKPDLGNLIVRVGGPAYRIGMGGGSASSRNQDTENEELDYDAVQRGDAQVENKVCRFVSVCQALDRNPILTIHDQGSGGMGNVTKEIVEPNGALVSLNNVTLGDKTLCSNEIWNAEYQEQISILIHPKDIELIKQIGEREGVNIDIVGVINNTGRIQVYNKNDKVNPVIDLNLDEVLNNIPRKKYDFRNKQQNTQITSPLLCKPELFNEYVEKVLMSINVGSKRFLTNKVDRSVTGLIAGQQCIGPFHTPLSDYSITAFSMMDTRGTACSIGEQPIKGLLNIDSMVEMTIGEMFTNLVFVGITDFRDIKCLGNWMWSPKLKNNGQLLYDAVLRVENILKILKIGIDGGKDSLSMNTKINDNVVMSPNTLVMSSYVLCPDIRVKVTPDFKKAGSIILFVDLSYYNYNLGGSQFAQNLGQLGSQPPRFRNIKRFPYIFNFIQRLLNEGKILSGHDRSDGGLISTLAEMCISSYYGCDLNIKSTANHISYLFNEELGLVIEVNPEDLTYVLENLNNYCPVQIIGRTTLERNFKIQYNDTLIYENSVINMWKQWEFNSFEIEKEQCESQCAYKEYSSIVKRKPPYQHISNLNIDLIKEYSLSTHIHHVGIIREVGSNGDKEMASAFYQAGFNVCDITMTDLINDPGVLNRNLNGVAFVGGFSYSDVFGAGVGWASRIKNNIELKENMDRFFNDPKKFSLGICNGCQLMSLLGILPNIRLVKNDSKRFESRYVSIKILESNCIFTRDMENTTFGMWSAHGEGKFVLNHELDENEELSPLRYVDDDGNITDSYPFNPNGSPDGIASICSRNGRHLAIMPHPERCFKDWQCPYINPDIEKKIGEFSPWFGLFKNAYKFCENNIDVL